MNSRRRLGFNGGTFAHGLVTRRVRTAAENEDRGCLGSLGLFNQIFLRIDHKVPLWKL